MKIEFISPFNIENVKLNSLVIWTDDKIRLFDKEILHLIKNEDEFLYKQFKDKRTLEKDNILFCSGIENNIDSYIVANVYYPNNLLAIDNSIKNINKLIQYIDVVNINKLGIIKPKIKISENKIKNNTLIYKSILIGLRKNTKLKKIYFITEDIQEIKLIKLINFLLKIPFFNKYI